MKTAIAPIIAVLALAVQAIFGIEVSEDLQSQLALFLGNGVFLGVTLYGIIKSHKKKRKVTPYNPNK